MHRKPPAYKATHKPANKPADQLKRYVLMIIMVLSWISSASAWSIVESRGESSMVLRWVFGANLVFHPVFFVITWRKLLPLRFVDMACLLFAAVLCSLCMALRLYSPEFGERIDVQALYIWIPVIHVFVFTLMGHKSSLRLSLLIFALFIAISVPYLAQWPIQPLANFTVQLHIVSAILIAALYFFSSYQHRFQIAQLTADELARLANTDELTKLANRRRMTEALNIELLRFGRYGHPFAVILMDIDHFKHINDSFGHGMGDQALKAMATRAKEVLRDVDMLGRWGGEEFIAVMPETEHDQGLQKAIALCRHVAATPLMDGHTVSISCGVATVTAGDTLASLLQRADTALYAAKRGGRNRAEGSISPTSVTAPTAPIALQPQN